jgi:uncharacterized repeat protein (TIGR03803 family)
LVPPDTGILEKLRATADLTIEGEKMKTTLAALVTLVLTNTERRFTLAQLLTRSLIRSLILALLFSASFSNAQTIHNFVGTDGQNPFGGLAAGSNGVLYGITAGGSFVILPGTVIQLTPPSSPGASWTESVIAAVPQYGEALSTPTVGPKGEIYATAYFGGTYGTGSVFEVTPPPVPGGEWSVANLYSFNYANGDPQNPQGAVVLGKNGVLYGTVQFAGISTNCPYYGCGAVYSLTPPSVPGGSWTEQTLYTFLGGTDGAVPQTALAIGKNGELYGTTTVGGGSVVCTQDNIPAGAIGPHSTGCGTVFELVPPTTPGAPWTETQLYSFTGGKDGGFPNQILYREGTLYGTADFGGDPKYCGGSGCGTVFQLTSPYAPGSAWTEKTLYSFKSVPDGLIPGAGLVIDREGNLYGSTHAGGDSENCPQNPGCGTIFKLTPSWSGSEGWQEEVLHSFDSTDGWRPTAALTLGDDGNLYGTTYYGGTSAYCTGGCGTAFKIDPRQPRNYSWEGSAK